LSTHRAPARTGEAAAKLSSRQAAILDFIQAYSGKHRYPPTVREIGDAVGIGSTSVVDYNLRKLAQKGVLRRVGAISRGIELAADLAPTLPTPIRRVPVVGTVAAGAPIDAIASADDYVTLARDMAGPGAYALRVRGTSMIEDLIADGDLVVVLPRATARDGEMVVALLDTGPGTEGQATLKRFYRDDQRIRLQPANAAMEPIYVAPERLRIQGTVQTIIRHLA
jgi:repressor LexA